MPSTQANANFYLLYLPIQRRAQSAFFVTQGTVSMALNSRSFSFGSLIYVSKSKQYISDITLIISQAVSSDTLLSDLQSDLMNQSLSAEES